MKAMNAITANLTYMFPKIKDCVKTYKDCSKNVSGNRYVVDSEVKVIDFDLLTKWIYKQNLPQSADSLNFTADGSPCFIEFKETNTSRITKSCEKLIRNVIGKINDSDTTLRKKVLNDIEMESERSDFFLVVSIFDVNEEAITIIQAELSGFDNENSRYHDKWEKLRGDLMNGLDNPDHFNEVDVWYAELFDLHLKQCGIRDVSIRT